MAQVWDLAGQVAIVTGASSGLGRHFATVLHGAGAAVVLAARRADRLEELASALGDRALAVRADVADPSDRQRVVDAAVEVFGRLDILVNNAGLANDGLPTVFDETEEGFRLVQDVNVVGVFLLCQLAGSVMLEQGGGRIVNVGSMFGTVAPRGDVAYAASKGAVDSMTRALAVQWARKRVQVNTLAPGFFPSDMSEKVSENQMLVDWIRQRCPTGRFGRLEELDAPLLFLCSPGISYVTGQTLHVDGGWTAG